MQSKGDFPPQLTPQTIYEMAANYFMIARTLQVAAQLDIFTPLMHKADTSEALAQQLGVSARGLEMLLVACTALGLLEKQGERYQTSDSAATLLVRGQPGYRGHLLAGSAGVYRDWLQLDEAVHTGQPVAPTTRAKDAESLRQFVLGMHASSQYPARLIAGMLTLRGRQRLLDVGGGSGAFAIAFCQKYAQVTATVLDVPEVVAIAQEVIAQAELAQRICTRGADYTCDPFPPGHDVVLLCNVLHQEDETTAQMLLQKSYAALRSTGTLVILDVLLNDEKTGPLSVALGALNNLIHNRGGTIHSAQEITQWMRKAGFHEPRQLSLPLPDMALLIAAKTT